MTSTNPQDRAGAAQLEPDDLDQSTDSTASSDSTSPTPTSVRAGRAALTKIPEYQGLRVAHFTYVEYSTGEKELYDLTKDPTS